MSPIADSAAFRKVFASEDETLLLAIVHEDQVETFRQCVSSVDSLQKKGAKIRLVAFDQSGALRSSFDSVDWLDPWAVPLLPAVLGSVDAVLLLSPDTKDLTFALEDSKRKAPPVLKDSGELLKHFGAPAIAAPSRFVLHNDWGIGDELLLSAVAREIVRAHPTAEVWIRSRYGFRFPSYVQATPPPADARRVETIYQNATLYGPEAHSPFPGHLVQQMLDKVANDTGLKVKARDVRPELSIRPLARSANPTVVLHSRPNPRLPSKDWGLERWDSLAKILLASGAAVKQVGEKGEPLLSGVEDLRGVPPAELPETLAQSWAVVSVVGFLMHLAGATRTPAVVIYGGREHPAIDGYSDQIHLSSEPLECRGRWGCHLGPDLSCPHSMRCMESITPDLVAREVLALMRGLRS